MKTLSIFFLSLGIILSGIGGMMDMMERDRFLTLSKQHYWNDGILMILLAIFFTVHK